jgi:hypothetical protein
MTKYIYIFFISKNSIKSTDGRNPSTRKVYKSAPNQRKENKQESKKSANDILPGLCADTQRYNILSTFLQRAPIGTSTSSKILEFLSRHKPHKTHKGTYFQIRLTGPRHNKVPQPFNKSRTLLGITHSTPNKL